MKNIKSFEAFVNESVHSVNEGTLASQGVAKLKDYSLNGAHDEDLKDFDDELAKLLGEKDWAKIIQVDSEIYEENPLLTKIWNYLESHFRGTYNDMGDDYFQNFEYDKNLNVAKVEDYGFTGYLFTAKSKF